MDFFEEYRKLKLATPRCALFNIASQNSDYSAYSRYNKNCYLLYGGDYNEDCLYGYWVYHDRDCTDSAYIYDSELLYECVDCRKCYNCNFCQDCAACTDCSFLYNCHGCQDCYGCVNLKQAQYNIFNKKYSREEYFKELKKLKALPISEQQRRFDEFALKHPRVYMRQFNNENCAGDHVYNSKNCYSCYDVQDSQDCVYLAHALKMKDCADGDFMYGAEMCFEGISIEGFNCNFCYVVWESSDMEFCELCFGCKNCFGCIGLQHKEYYILNKPYAPEKYFKKVAEIKAQLRAEKKYNASLPEVFWEG